MISLVSGEVCRSGIDWPSSLFLLSLYHRPEAYHLGVLITQCCNIRVGRYLATHNLHFLSQIAQTPDTDSTHPAAVAVLLSPGITLARARTGQPRARWKMFKQIANGDDVCLLERRPSGSIKSARVKGQPSPDNAQIGGRRAGRESTRETIRACRTHGRLVFASGAWESIGGCRAPRTKCSSTHHSFGGCAHPTRTTSAGLLRQYVSQQRIGRCRALPVLSTRASLALHSQLQAVFAQQVIDPWPGFKSRDLRPPATRIDDHVKLRIAGGWAGCAVDSACSPLPFYHSSLPLSLPTSFREHSIFRSAVGSATFPGASPDRLVTVMVLESGRGGQ